MYLISSSLVICLSFLTFTSQFTKAQNLDELRNNIRKQCQEKFPTLKTDVFKDFYSKGEIPDEHDEIQLCYLECMFKNIRSAFKQPPLSKDDGGLILENIINFISNKSNYLKPKEGLSKEKITENVNECAKLGLDTNAKCLKSFKIWKCIYKKNHGKD